MTRQMALQFLDSLIDYEKITTYAYDAMKLERVELLLEALGNPQNAFRCIHVAGSRGKGSTCAMVYSILREADVSAGLYTSPHLVSRLERIRIAKKGEKDRVILEEELADLAEKIRPVAERLSRKGKGRFTFFEVFTALSFLFFKEKGVEIAVLEVGMGGRLDATNVVHPLVTAITPISYDHTDKLGKTLTEIAREKAQILKEETVAIVSHQEPEPLAEIRRNAASRRLTLLEVSSLYSYSRLERSEEGTRFDVKGPKKAFTGLFLPLLGDHQVRNALVAVAICESLSEKGVAHSEEVVRRGLATLDWPGRFQIVAHDPMVIIDGAQDGTSALALKETFLDLFKDRPLFLILGISANKEVDAVCRILCPLAESVIVTQAENVRALDAAHLEKQARPYAKRLRTTLSVEEALELARAEVGPRGIILVAGSLYLVGELLAQFQNKRKAQEATATRAFESLAS